MTPTVDKLAAAFKQHYESLGNEGRPGSLAVLRAGYYTKGENGKTVTCVLDAAEVKTTLDFDYADTLKIDNPLDIITEVKITTKGRVTNVDSVHMEFEALPDVRDMPKQDVDWKGGLFGEKKEPVQPDKKRKSEQSPAPSPTAPFISKSGAKLSEALRKKLKKQDSDPKSQGGKKDGKSASSSSEKKG